jgi:hypothetical protein
MVTFKEWLGIVAQIVSTTAIIIGGVWTYRLFVRQRTNVARANLTQTVEKVDLTAGKTLVRLGLAVENKGNTSIQPRTLEAFVHNLRPITDADLGRLEAARPPRGETDDTLDWPELGRRELDLYTEEFMVEPGETAHLWVDFLIPNGIEVFQVYSRLDCGKTYGDLYWDVTSIVRSDAQPQKAV